MKRTVSMAVLGLAVASSSAVAGVFISPADRAARQQERAASERRDERGPGPSHSGPRGDAPRNEPPRSEPPRSEPPRGDASRGGGGGRPDERRWSGPRGQSDRDGRNDLSSRGYQPQPDGSRRDGYRDRRDGRDGQDSRDGRDNRSDRHYGDHRDLRGNRDYRGPVAPRSSWQGARPRGWDDGQRRGWRDERGRDWHYSRDWYDRYRAEHFRYDRGRYLARERFSIGIYFVPRGYAPRYWQRGQWLPTTYYGERRYHLVDYWRFDLYDPPFGARWVRVGDDALLIDYGSGEILDVVYELFW